MALRRALVLIKTNSMRFNNTNIYYKPTKKARPFYMVLLLFIYMIIFIRLIFIQSYFFLLSLEKSIRNAVSALIPFFR